MYDRKLVHWINSLPITSCLLIEELTDLRFGDVLWAIVAWLQTGHEEIVTLENTIEDTSQHYIKHIVKFLNKECCSDDGMVIHMVQDAENFSARIQEGDINAIRGVVLVLRRVAQERLRVHTAEMETARRMTMRDASRSVSKLTQHLSKDSTVFQSSSVIVPLDNKKNNRRVSKLGNGAGVKDAVQPSTDGTSTGTGTSTTRSMRRLRPSLSQVKREPLTKRKTSASTAPSVTNHRASSIYQAPDGLHVYSMIDPTMKSIRKSQLIPPQQDEVKPSPTPLQPKPATVRVNIHRASVPPRHKLVEEQQMATTPRTKPYITVEQMKATQKWIQEDLQIQCEWNDTEPCGLLEDSLRNGITLCEVVSRLFPTAFFMIQPPKTVQEARRNITTAISHTGSALPPIYHRSDAVDGVLMRDKQYLYGILWNLWQRAKPTKPQSTGSNFLVDLPAVELMDMDLESDWASGFHIPWDGDDEGEDDLIPRPLLHLNDTTTKVKDVEEFEDIVPVPHVVQRSAVVVSHVDPQPTVVESLSKSDSFSIDHSSLSSQIAPIPSPEQSSSQDPTPDESTPTLPPEIPSPTVEELPPPPPPPSLEIPIKRPQDLYDFSASLVDFQSGVLLCLLVEKITFCRSWTGVYHPKSGTVPKAHALHNIDKALSVLLQNKTIPPSIGRRKMDIWRGDYCTIMRLLLLVFKAHGPNRNRHKSSVEILL